MRLTRAALRAEASTEDQIVDASIPHSDLKERVPLGEVSANTVPEISTVEGFAGAKMPPKKSKAKGGAKKGAKGKKGKQEDQVADVVEVLEDERLAAGSPASDAASDELAKGHTDDIVQVPMADHRPASPPSRAVRMTRRQLAMQEEELSRSMQAQPLPDYSDRNIMLTPKRVETYPDEIVFDDEPEEATAGAQEDVAAVEEEGVNGVSAVEEPEPVRTIEESVQVTAGAGKPEPDYEGLVSALKSEVAAFEVAIQKPSDPEPKTLITEKPSESEAATPAQSRTPSRAPSRSPAKSPMRLEESFEAIDALEEALESVGKAIPALDNSADEKSPRKAQFDAVARLRSGTPRKSPLKVSRNPGVPKSLKPTAAPRGSLARSASTRAAPSKDMTRKGSGEATDYLASKRRPISMSFPTPPPPQRSTKAPTKSTFQLPGEAIAAKLKAQKEERLKREQEEGKRAPSATFVAPAPPKSTKPPTKSTFQLPGEAVAARLKAQKEERLRREAEEGPRPQTFTAPAPPKSTKPPTKANFQLPGEAIAAKLKAQREERQKREEEDAAATKKPAFKARPVPTYKPSSAPVRQTASSKARENLMTGSASTSREPGLSRTSSVGPASTAATKRNSSIMSRTSSNTSNRNSMILSGSAPGLVTKSTVTAAEVTAQRMKAREIFNRDKYEKDARERERRDKEEAAKKARAEAAERGRIASREWAERQKRKVLGPSSNGGTQAA